MRVILLILFNITGFACAHQPQGTSVTDTATNNRGLQYIALGDSYTIGESVNLDQSFPYQLKTTLAKQGFKVTDPKIIAVTGWTTADLIDAIAREKLTRKYDFVTLLIGVNNQYQGKSQAQYRTQFIQLLNTSIAFANGNKQHVFVLSIPDYSVTPFAQGSDIKQIATEINEFNAINLAESAKAGVNYLDITTISRQAATDPALIAPDGLHPSAQMYRLWVNALEPTVAVKLK